MENVTVAPTTPVDIAAGITFPTVLRLVWFTFASSVIIGVPVACVIAVLQQIFK